MFDLEKLRDRRVAIVGGAGFVGHTLALKLAELGAQPHVVDGLQVNNLGYYSSGYNNIPNAELYLSFINERLGLLREARVPLHLVDARDYHQLTRTITDIQPELVVHLAAVAHANRSNKDPFSTFDHSLRTLENVLDAIRSSGIPIIFFSSSMVYGNFEGEVVSEDRACEPIGIYGALKYGAERLIIGHNQVFGMPYTIIRPSALYGERCVSRRVGQAFIESALLGEDLVINGDGTEGLDFTYVDDVIQGVILAATRNEAVNEIFNITFGEARKLNQLAELVISHFPESKVRYNPRDGLMPERGALNIDKARDLLGYEPLYPVEDGFVRYVHWYQEFAGRNPQLFRNVSD